MSIIVKRQGILDSFQDAGRSGFQRFGINTNGVMDLRALTAANILLGNATDEAALEMHFPAPVLEFRQRVSLVLSGADFGAELSGLPIDNLRPYTAQTDSILKFTERFAGNRSYLSVKNGFRLDDWLFSNSTNLVAQVGGFHGRCLQKGDEVTFKRAQTTDHSLSAGFRFFSREIHLLRFVPGPDFIDLTAESELAFLSENFKISADSNRMGYRLGGRPLNLLDSSQRTSKAVTFGTVQLLPNGQLVILMADHQTTGGYPDLGTIIGPDLAIAAQLGRNDLVAFAPIAVDAAEKPRLETENEFASLRTGMRLRGFEAE